VCRRRLRAHLVQQCADAGVRFVAGEVSDVDAAAKDASARIKCSDGRALQARCLFPGQESLSLVWHPQGEKDQQYVAQLHAW